MASLNSLQTRSVLSRGVVGQVGDNLGKLFSLKFIGAGSVTSVIVTTATDLTIVTSAGTYVYDWATYPTVGQVVDKINADGQFTAKILDALMSTPTGSGLAVAGTLSADQNGEYAVMSDTANANFLAYRLTFDRTQKNSVKLALQHRVHLQEVITDLTLGSGADANSFKVYETTPTFRGCIETLIYQKTPTTGTISTTNWASGNGKITGGEGNDLVIVISDADSITGTVTVTGLVE